jgi:hypothetical protein
MLLTFSCNGDGGLMGHMTGQFRVPLAVLGYINFLKPQQKSEKLNFLKIFIKISNNCLYLPYNSLDKSWFPFFLRINCAK